MPSYCIFRIVNILLAAACFSGALNMASKHQDSGQRRTRPRLVSFAKRDDGSVSLEFALLGPVFFILAFGVIEIALISLGATGVKAGLSDIGREIRTGRAQCVTEQQVVDTVCRFSLVGYCSTALDVEQSVVSNGATNSVADELP